MAGSETCFGQDNLFASPLLEVHEQGSLKIAGAGAAGGSDHASNEHHSRVGVSDAQGFPLPVRNHSFVITDYQRGIDDEKAYVGTVCTLKPAKRCDFLARDQAESLAVVKPDQPFLELNRRFSNGFH